jgi:Bacterial regulatory proteins, tetR family
LAKVSWLANFFSTAAHTQAVPLWYYTVPDLSRRAVAKASVSKGRQNGGDEPAVRERILAAAFATFMKSGYATASMLEIATRARVSKRELYALVGNKQEMLIACISERAKRFSVPSDLPVLRDRETLEVCPRGKRSHRHCGIPTSDLRGDPGPGSGARTRL